MQQKLSYLLENNLITRQQFGFFYLSVQPVSNCLTVSSYMLMTLKLTWKLLMILIVQHYKLLLIK